MGKGSCKKTQTLEQERKQESEDEASRSRNISTASKTKSEEKSDINDSLDKKNKNLIMYVEHILKDPTNQSLTKNHVSMEMAEDLVNVRTADNVGLGQCIYVNYHDRLTKLPYASSPDCYGVFCDFFGPLIDDYHGQTREEAHFEPRYGNLDKIAMLDLNTPERSRIIYSDMIVRRNIGGQPFTPMMSAGGRKDIISKLENVFRNIFEKDKEMERIPIRWTQRMELIRGELEATGSMKSYPNERLQLAFEAQYKMQEGIVLNYDDHLQIITSCNDGRLGLLYRNMFDIITNEGLDNIDFIVHPVYGYLTLSPAYIGTGTTIRLIAKFPFLSRIVDVEDSILKNYDVHVELDGKPCSASGLMILSNKNTLNKSEAEILSDVVDAYKMLCELEEELERTYPMAIQNDVMPCESLSRLVDMISKSESKSYTKKYLTAGVVNRSENVTTVFNNSLGSCIRQNAYFPESLYPRAGDGDCYTKFRQFFTPILYETNKISSTSHPNKPEYGIASENNMFMLCHRDILSYRVRFCRNFEEFPFPMSMSDIQRTEMERLLLHAFQEFPVEIEGEYCPLGVINNSPYFQMCLKYNLLPNSNAADISSGCYRSWPQHRGIFFSKADSKYPELILVILVNVTEHIKVICLDPNGKSFHSCYDRAVKVMKYLDLRFEKMFAKKTGYGFLTSFPQSVGCGLRISALVFLKNLGDKREILEQVCKASQFVMRGSKGALSPAIKNVFDISIKANMNVTEKWIALTFCQRLKELLYSEGAYDPRIPNPSNEVFVQESASGNDTSHHVDIQSVPVSFASQSVNSRDSTDVKKNRSTRSESAEKI